MFRVPRKYFSMYSSIGDHVYEGDKEFVLLGLIFQWGALGSKRLNRQRQFPAVMFAKKGKNQVMCW